jgi:hypothetical protein
VLKEISQFSGLVGNKYKKEKGQTGNQVFESSILPLVAESQHIGSAIAQTY